jgi:diguanylate cyclase (GGDEF)-like protein
LEQESLPILGPLSLCEHVVIQNVGFDISDFLFAEIAVVDPTGAITSCNRKWAETASIGMLLSKQPGWNYIAECEAAIQRSCVEAAEILAGLRAVLNGDLSSFVATYACPFNELHHWFEVLISVFECDRKRHAILMHVDVSALQRDSLTGLPNRAMFDAQLDLAVSLARDTGRQTGVVIIDMNRLKVINDMHGHRVGDEALIALATEIKKITGQDCLAARIGGDEFGVVLPANYDTLSAWRMRDRFKSGIACSIGAEPNRMPISASVGIALFPDDGGNASALLKSADESMYAQKRSLSVA